MRVNNDTAIYRLPYDADFDRFDGIARQEP